MNKILTSICYISNKSECLNSSLPEKLLVGEF